jgi:threonine/homoserine/homoserine lactone efflux protein
VISLSAALGIALVALGMVLTPGPNMIYLVSRTLAQGRTAGLVSLLGVGVGFLIYMSATALGLIAIFTAVPVLYDIIKIAGAGYLLWLAYQAFRSGKGTPFVARELPSHPNGKLFTMGLLTNLLNPKVAIIYVSLLPQFIEPARGHIALQGLTLGLVQCAVALTFNSLWVLSASTIAGWLSSRPQWVNLQRWFMGTVLGALAIRLLFERVRPVSA